jgi:hypothetical protein
MREASVEHPTHDTDAIDVGVTGKIVSVVVAIALIGAVGVYIVFYSGLW